MIFFNFLLKIVLIMVQIRSRDRNRSQNRTGILACQKSEPEP
jgi:hypothetical protein